MIYLGLTTVFVLVLFINNTLPIEIPKDIPSIQHAQIKVVDLRSGPIFSCDYGYIPFPGKTDIEYDYPIMGVQEVVTLNRDFNLHYGVSVSESGSPFIHWKEASCISMRSIYIHKNFIVI